MARYPRYRRTYFKKVYPRKRWASCMKTGLLDLTIQSGHIFATAVTDLCINSADRSTPNPVIVKFGRFKMKGDLRYSASAARAVSSCMVYVLYVPEGSNVDQNFITAHPEYLLGWTCLSLESGGSFSLSSGLKRNLNSGDSIKIFFYADTLIAPQEALTFALYFHIQYWTTSA